ncbi:hypothetical protein [Parasediminibacterium sp. JCM 36343]|uniref:hypothetical protein n=1 Tax=Parasediminibacterium sp. JCM 36343 TaxID=3374279 RepID=UPI00397E47BA
MTFGTSIPILKTPHTPQLIIAALGFKAGATKSLTEHVDIFRTVCNLAGVPLPDSLDGKSLVPIMQNKKAMV